MGRRTTIAVMGSGVGDWEDRLRDESYDVKPAGPAADANPVAGPDAAGSDANGPDLVLIDGAGRTDLIDAVRACRDRWPSPTTPVLVLGVGDPDLGSAAIEAGATDAVVDSEAGPMLRAHIRRLLRSTVVLRELIDDERRRAKQESLAIAAADMAVPLSDLLDKLESDMAHSPSDRRLDELLELTSRAVDAVDRLRELAALPAESPEDPDAPA